jgi:hypothetical protein
MNIRRGLVSMMLCAVAAVPLRAEVTVVEHHTLKNALEAAGQKPPHEIRATGSQALIDNSGFEYFINTNITFATSSSASAAASEASYTHAVAATTLNGGTVSTTLNDAFDGYNSLCISLNNTVTPCVTGDANIVIYNQLGAATTECQGATSGVDRQVVFPTKTNGNLQIRRKVFVPDNDAFARWLNIFTNTGAAPMTVTMVTGNNLGSDANTTIAGTSSGNTTAELTDTWVGTFQNYSGTTTSDPRLAHVLQGPGATAPLTGINFANGDDNPYWGYTFILAPGETKTIMNFVVGQPSNAAAAAKANQLVGLPPNALQCLSTTEQGQVANFRAVQQAITEVPALDTTGLLVLAGGLVLAALAMLRRLRSTPSVS